LLGTNVQQNNGIMDGCILFRSHHPATSKTGMNVVVSIFNRIYLHISCLYHIPIKQHLCMLNTLHQVMLLYIKQGSDGFNQTQILCMALCLYR
jgi:hypothetical protein